MATYSEELRQNRANALLPPNPCYEEFKLLKLNGCYKYDPCYDYATEVLPSLIADYKRYGLEEPDKAARLTLYEKINPDISLHKRAYEYWTDMKWRQFEKSWKPKDTDGLNFLWITLNYVDGLPINDVLIETARIVNLPVFKQTKITYCYEYYTDKGHHPHVHMLVEMKTTGTIAFATIKEKIFQKKSLRLIMSENIKFSWANKPEMRCWKRAVCIAYLNGMKIDKKQEDCEKDKLWRIENNLEDIYIKDNN